MVTYTFIFEHRQCNSNTNSKWLFGNPNVSLLEKLLFMLCWPSFHNFLDSLHAWQLLFLLFTLQAAILVLTLSPENSFLSAVLYRAAVRNHGALYRKPDTGPHTVNASVMNQQWVIGTAHSLCSFYERKGLVNMTCLPNPPPLLILKDPLVLATAGRKRRG